MPSRITTSIELCLGTLTVASTLITGEFLADLVIGIATYTSARLFYFYFGTKIKAFIGRIKNKFKK